MSSDTYRKKDWQGILQNVHRVCLWAIVGKFSSFYLSRLYKLKMRYLHLNVLILKNCADNPERSNVGITELIVVRMETWARKDRESRGNPKLDAGLLPGCWSRDRKEEAKRRHGLGSKKALSRLKWNFC